MSPRPLVTIALSSAAVLAALLAPALRPTPTPSPTPTPTLTLPTAEPAPLTLPSPSPGVHATLTADRDRVLASGDRTVRLRLDLHADAGQGRRLPTDLVVVMDRSGSMSGDKILDARAAARELVGQLGPEDRFALVSFSSEARVDVPLSVVGDPEAWDRAIDRLEAGGSTQMGLGLEAGLDQIATFTPGRIRRMVLVSDGLPDQRDGLDPIARRAASRETPLTTIGIGVDYDEALMQSLADAGTGNFHWVQRGPDLARVLADELDTARETIASGLALDLRGAELVDASGYPVDQGRVALGTLFAGQKRTLWLTVRVPAGVEGDFDLGDVALAWTTPQGQRGTLVADAPVVGVTHDAAAFYASLGDGWADSVVNDDWNRLKIEVSASVQQGNRADALAAIDRYYRGNELMNAYAANPLVADNLEEAQALAADVEQQFVGDDQRSRQNFWAKSTRVDGYSGSRAGQLKNVK